MKLRSFRTRAKARGLFCLCWGPYEPRFLFSSLFTNRLLRSTQARATGCLVGSMLRRYDKRADYKRPSKGKVTTGTVGGPEKNRTPSLYKNPPSPWVSYRSACGCFVPFLSIFSLSDLLLYHNTVHKRRHQGSLAATVRCVGMTSKAGNNISIVTYVAYVSMTKFGVWQRSLLARSGTICVFPSAAGAHNKGTDEFAYV